MEKLCESLPSLRISVSPLFILLASYHNYGLEYKAGVRREWIGHKTTP